MRYAWDQYRHYFAPERLSWWNRRAIPALIGRMRAWDVATAGRPHRYAANSQHVAARIRSAYGREAEVIYPPVDLSGLRPGDGAGGYYLMVNAFAPYKRVDLAVEAFNRLGRELLIIGTGQDDGPPAPARRAERALPRLDLARGTAPGLCRLPRLRLHRGGGLRITRWKPRRAGGP